MIRAAAALVPLALSVHATDVRLAFDRTAARPGTRIHARAVELPRKGPFDVFLVPRQYVIRVRSTGDPRMTFVGRLSATRHRLTFTVPRVRPGYYVAIVSCDECGPEGIVPAGPFPGGFRVL
jgi:hypothetical protein